MKNTPYLLLVILLASSCHRALFGNHPDKMVLPAETTLTYPCLLSKESQHVTCDEVVLTRIKDLDETARNPVKTFEDQFKGVFYNDFFEQILVEPDVRKMLRKEVVVDIVQLKEDVTGSLLKNCSTCNAVATLHWKDQTHLYPYTADAEIINTLEDHYKCLGITPNLEFVLYQNRRGKNVKVSFISSKNVTRSYKLTTGTKEQLLDVLRAFKFPKKERVKPK